MKIKIVGRKIELYENGVEFSHSNSSSHKNTFKLRISSCGRLVYPFDYGDNKYEADCYWPIDRVEEIVKDKYWIKHDKID